VDDLIVRTRADVDDLLERADRRPVIGVTLRCVRDLLSIDVRDRIFGMTGQSFLALVPLMIIFASFVSVGGQTGLAALINARLQLDPSTARAVVLLFSSPGAASVTASALSLVILLLSVNSYTRTMRRSIERPWQLPRSNWRGQVHGLVAVGLFLVMHFTIAVVATAWRGGPVATAGPEVVAQTLMAIGFWWVITYLLATRRIPWRHLLPGALVGGVAQSMAGWWSAVFLPTIIERDISRYGVIGVSLGIVTWLLVMSGITVGVGIVGAQVARAVGWLEAPAPADTEPATPRTSP
jgi:uncharacterized BrkB/YihY/UPF0761 family membrane protein